MVSGGHQFDGRELGPIKDEEITNAVKEFQTNNIENFVICGVFSSIKPEHEIKVSDLNFFCFGNFILLFLLFLL